MSTQRDGSVGIRGDENGMKSGRVAESSDDDKEAVCGLGESQSSVPPTPSSKPKRAIAIFRRVMAGI